ncbi:MAG TPA: hypothetical protein VLF39_02935 [Candidatus Saccharimonadales bacterium]|nr:hypothetical protein [Candidatus Saccharimonadales bacterium]
MTKQLKLIFITAGVIVAASLVVAGVIKLSSNYLNRQTDQQSGVEKLCRSGNHQTLTVVIKNGAAIPADTHGNKCDRLTITNTDNHVRLMAFGQHDNHITYDGVSEKALSTGDSLTVTLVQSGTFIFHDHIDDRAQGSFTVTP